MPKKQKEITGSLQHIPPPDIKNTEALYPVKNQDGSSNLTNPAGENPVQKTTVFISPVNKLWQIQTGETTICKAFILKSTAIAAAIKYVATRPEGRFSQIEIKGKLGNNDVYWVLGVDEFPPQKRTCRHV